MTKWFVARSVMGSGWMTTETCVGSVEGRDTLMLVS